MIAYLLLKTFLYQNRTAVKSFELPIRYYLSTLRNMSDKIFELNQALILQEFKLWDARRNGCSQKAIDEITLKICSLRIAIQTFSPGICDSVYPLAFYKRAWWLQLVEITGLEKHNSRTLQAYSSSRKKIIFLGIPVLL